MKLNRYLFIGVSLLASATVSLAQFSTNTIGNVGLGINTPTNALLDIWGGGNQPLLNLLKAGGDGDILTVLVNNPPSQENQVLGVSRNRRVVVGNTARTDSSLVVYGAEGINCDPTNASLSVWGNSGKPVVSIAKVGDTGAILQLYGDYPYIPANLVLSADRDGSVTIGSYQRPDRSLIVHGEGSFVAVNITCDENQKAGFASVNQREILAKVDQLDLSTWHYTNSPGIPHLGPMAQQFHQLFGLGRDNKHIATVDADGVLFACVQELHQEAKAKDRELAAMREELAQTKLQLAATESRWEQRLAALEKLLAPGGEQADAVKPRVEDHSVARSQE